VFCGVKRNSKGFQNFKQNRNGNVVACLLRQVLVIVKNQADGHPMHLTAGKCQTQSSKLKRRRGALSKFCKLANQSQGVKSELSVQLFLPTIVVTVKEGPCQDVFCGVKRNSEGFQNLKQNRNGNVVACLLRRVLAIMKK